MRPPGTSAPAFAPSLAAGVVLARQRQGDRPQDTQRMERSKMQGMDHSRTKAQGGQVRQPTQ